MNMPLNIHPMKNLLFKAAKPITGRILGLKNRHQGESCYILGDGVSMKWFDLKVFSGKLAFTLSCIPFHKQANMLNIRYGLLTEPYYFYPYLHMPSWSAKRWWRNKIKDRYLKLFKNNPKSEYFVNLSNFPILRRGENIFYLYRTIEDDNFNFLKECVANSEGIYDGSFRSAIALAIYMGFKDIVLVGCDYTHEVSRSLHWYEKGKGILNSMPDYQRRYLEVAQKYAKITTITLEGGGSVLPAMTYTEFTGQPLAFRENFELTNMGTLEILATWPGYTIF